MDKNEALQLRWGSSPWGRPLGGGLEVLHSYIEANQVYFITIGTHPEESQPLMDIHRESLKNARRITITDQVSSQIGSHL